MIPIPAIDLLDGKVVRLQKGDYATPTVYFDNPLDAARQFEDAGIQELHVVDLNGARDGHFGNLKAIEAIANHTSMTLQSGGGVRSFEDAETLIASGITRVVCSSMAARQPEQFDKLIDLNEGAHAVLGMDIKNGQFAYGGWQHTSSVMYQETIERFRVKGLRYVLSTDIDRDGMMQGPNIALYRSMLSDFPQLNFIASGGVAGAEDLEELSKLPLYGVIVGKAYYEKKLSLEQLKHFVPAK